MKFRLGNQVFDKIEDYMSIESLYEKAEVWIEADKEKWNHMTFLGYFIVKYRSTYGVYYRFSRWKNDPTKTKEFRDFSKLLKEFQCGINMTHGGCKKIANVKLYNYINWIFDKKFRNPKVVTGSGIFLKSNLINEFEVLYARKLKEHKRNNSISILKDWLSLNAPSILDDYSINDKNDINIFKNFYINSNLPNNCPETVFYNKLREMRLV